MNDERATIHLLLPGAPEAARLVVNEVDLTREVKRVIMETDGTSTRVAVELTNPEFEFHGVGVVEVIQMTEYDPAGAILEFLVGVDPQALEEAVLANHQNGTTGELFLLELRKMVDGGA